MAGHLNQANVYNRLALDCEPPLGSSGLALGTSPSVSAPPRLTVPPGSAALGHAVRPPPSPASSVYRSPPARLSSPASSVSSPPSVLRSPISPASRIRLAPSATSSSPAVYLITAPSSLLAPVTPSALTSGSLNPLLSSSAPVVLSPPPPPAPASSSAVIPEGAFDPLTQEEFDTLQQFFVNVPGAAVLDQPPAQADASPLPAASSAAVSPVSSPPVFTLASSPSVTSVASSPLSSDPSARPSRRGLHWKDDVWKWV